MAAKPDRVGGQDLEVNGRGAEVLQFLTELACCSDAMSALISDLKSAT